ncbi:MAG TPA: dihydrolipoamide acetyltransferase family protein [Nocardioidaceae bacterium]|nr:dihydrolipoamide acetyltransferase family protein [Nocardioidaceae bacterium]
MNEYKLPDVGEGLTEAEIVTWKVKVGDTIKVNDVVVEIETAKSLVELPSPYAGTVQELLVPEGETVAVGTPIIRIGDGAAAPAEQSPREPVAQEPGMTGSPAPKVEEEHKTLVGYGPREAQVKRRARRGAATPASQAGAQSQEQVQGAFTPAVAETPQPEPADEPAVPAEAPAAHAGGNVRVLAKPPVRKLAKDLGVDLRSITPTGPNATVTREDVQSAGSGAAAAEPGSVVEPVETRRVAPGERETREPIKGVRKMMAQAMVDSAYSAPHVTEWVTVDVTKTMRYVARLKADRAFSGVRVSPLLVAARAVCLAMRRTPEINATWDDAAQEVVYKHYVNLGIAAATTRGLVVPNVKDADAMGMVELAEAIGALTKTAREGKTQPGEMSGGTFTITNVGVFGVDSGTPIINPGESAILAFGAVRKQPWVHNGKIKARDVTTLALSFDHRLIDGEKGSRFLADVAAIMEDPANALQF